MMKNLVSTFIILIAAGIIALGWYAFSTTTASQSMLPTVSADFTQTVEPTSGQMPTSETSDGLPARLEGGEMGFSFIRIFTGMAANVGITALVIILIVWLRKLINRFASIHFNFV